MHHPFSTQSAALKYCLAVLGMIRVVTVSLSAQDVELTNYKTGIDLTFSGSKGSAYMEEYFYSDKLVSDRKVVYIRSDTSIYMGHNERNVARVTGKYYSIVGANGIDGNPNTGDEGVIRYKVDGDLNWGPVWTTGQGGTPNPAYSSALSFAKMTYPSGLSVLGRTGSNGAAITAKTSYFTYGILDKIGDEWHTLTVADDDWNVTTTDTEWRASDGKVVIFVVNPKTPALTVRATGNGQFYTTPPKTYFIPKIHDQTTYFNAGTGSVTFELKDLYGHDVFYRINGGSWIQAANPVLTQNNFSNGTNTLEYYYAGNQAYTKTRTVVKNPAFPSAAENHGYLLAGDPANYQQMLSRRLDTSAPYKYHWDREVSGASDSGDRNEWDTNRNKGLRYVPQGAVINALVAKINGITASAPGKTRSYAAYAKEMILQNARTIDNVGFEMNHPQTTLPTRELVYRGYYDVTTNLSMAYAYDLLISIYRSDQHADGITPIEDYFIRDGIANDIVENLMFCNALQSPYVNLGAASAGMWDTARKCGALVGMFAIPNYSTNYYGTAGLDGNTKVYPWTPFKDTPLTWKQVFLDEDQPMPGYPNLAQRFGIEQYMTTPDGDFFDRVNYVGLNGGVWYHAANVLKYHYPQKKMPNLEAFFLKAAKGTIMGLKDNSGPQKSIFLCVLNPHFPTVADFGVPYVTSLASSDGDADDQVINGHMPYALAWYDMKYKSGTSSPSNVPPSNAKVQVTVSGQ